MGGPHAAGHELGGGPPHGPGPGHCVLACNQRHRSALLPFPPAAQDDSSDAYVCVQQSPAASTAMAAASALVCIDVECSGVLRSLELVLS